MLIATLLLSFFTVFLSGVFWRNFCTTKRYFRQRGWSDLAFSIALGLAGVYNLISLIGISSGA